ncbi:hypothetical protein [Pajaroellobacter abortibovis]|uniref:hypothetical protein n=1 Tax=Pajaroellobacter abortibovis TaxID=1882918 RepID=UPI0015602CAC|nr:hypothetical protein [Pajaroellobacter abortibovis]
MVALITTWIFGVGGIAEGCGTIVYFKNDAFDPNLLIPNAIVEEGKQALVRDSALNMLQVRDAARGRLFPLGVASLLLGVVTVFFTGRTFRSVKMARPFLVQLVLVQTALIVLTYVLTPDVRRAENDYLMARASVTLSQALSREEKEQPLPFDYAKMIHTVPVIYLSVRCAMALFVVVALTRLRVKQFIEGVEVAQ